MRTLFSLLAALVLTFGLATAVSAQDDDADDAPTVTNEGDEESATAGDAAAADTDEGEVATAGDATAVDVDDADDDGGDDGGDDGAPAAPPTNLPTTGVGAIGGAGTGILAAIFGLFATASAAVSMRLRR